MILIDGCNRNHSNSRPVLARKPTSSVGRCYPSQAGLHPPGLLGMVCLVRLASDRFRCDHTGSTGLSSWPYGGSWNPVSHGRVRRSVPGR